MNAVSSSCDKVVYVLGAGFSKPAGAPSQAEILSDIFSLTIGDERAIRAREALTDFLSNDLSISVQNLADAALEDIYTPIDRCIADGTCFKGRTPAKLSELREDLGFLISHAIASRISTSQGSSGNTVEYVRQFAHSIVKKSSHRATLAQNTKSASAAKAYDPLSIISLNWDILLDNALHSAMQNENPNCGDYDPFGVVDYCCYISSLEPNSPRIRSGLWSLGCRGYNVKLLKLHGSMNWLQCPNCQRLFVDFGEKLQMLHHVGATRCRHCERYGYANHLQGSLVMPTFLKDLSNFQIKLVWQNAGVELMEAKHLVFVGYSLPHADFEFRQLLSRMVRRDASIEVVLYEGTTDASRRLYQAEVARYRQFFGSRNMSFHPSGVTEYVKSLTPEAAK